MGWAVGEVGMNINEAALCLVCLINVTSRRGRGWVGGELPQRPSGYAISASLAVFQFGEVPGGHGVGGGVAYIPVSHSGGRVLCLDRVGAVTVLNSPFLNLPTVGCLLLGDLEAGVPKGTQFRSAEVQCCLDRCGGARVLPSFWVPLGGVWGECSGM